MTRAEEIRAAEKDVADKALAAFARMGWFGDRWQTEEMRLLGDAVERISVLREPRDPIAEVHKWLARTDVPNIYCINLQELKDILDACEQDRKAPAR